MFGPSPLMRYRGEIELDLGESILPALINGLDDHMGAAYEEAFREHLRRLARSGDEVEGQEVVADPIDPAPRTLIVRYRHHPLDEPMLDQPVEHPCRVGAHRVLDLTELRLALGDRT